jgi:hypothetical protein
LIFSLSDLKALDTVPRETPLLMLGRLGFPPKIAQAASFACFITVETG